MHKSNRRKAFLLETIRFGNCCSGTSQHWNSTAEATQTIGCYWCTKNKQFVVVFFLLVRCFFGVLLASSGPSRPILSSNSAAACFLRALGDFSCDNNACTSLRTLGPSMLVFESATAARKESRDFSENTFADLSEIQQKAG